MADRVYERVYRLVHLHHKWRQKVHRRIFHKVYWSRSRAQGLLDRLHDRFINVVKRTENSGKSTNAGSRIEKRSERFSD